MNIKEHLKSNFKPKQLLLTILISAGIVTAFLIQPYRLGGTITTRSINCLAFIWEKKNPNKQLQFRKGDYVNFRVSQEDLSEKEYEFFKNLKLVKKVGCGPGDYLECGFGICTCNGEMIISALNERFSSKAFNYSSQIPPTHVFLLGDNDASYDGRYWGLTSVNTITGVVKKCLYTSKP
jgi:signal peptidase I